MSAGMRFPVQQPPAFCSWLEAAQAVLDRETAEPVEPNSALALALQNMTLAQRTVLLVAVLDVTSQRGETNEMLMGMLGRFNLSDLELEQGRRDADGLVEAVEARRAGKVC